MIEKACIKCHEFIMVHTNNPISQEIEKKFEKKHFCHTLVCMDLDEINDTYQKSDLM